MVVQALNADSLSRPTPTQNTIGVDESAVFRKLQGGRQTGSPWRVVAPAALVLAVAAGGLFFYQNQRPNTPAAPVQANPAPVAQEVAPPPVTPAPAMRVVPAVAPVPAPPMTPPVKVARAEAAPRVLHPSRPAAHKAARAATSAGENVDAFTPPAPTTAEIAPTPTAPAVQTPPPSTPTPATSNAPVNPPPLNAPTAP